MSVWSDHETFFRTAFTDALTDTCTVTEKTARGTYNPTTRRYDSPTDTLLYTGACLVRPGFQAEEQPRGQAQVTLTKYTVLLPYTATGIEPEAVVVVTACDDTELIGANLTVTDVEKDSFNARKVLRCELNEGRGKP